MTTFSGFDWDDGNRNKCQKHGVSCVEIESLFAGALSIMPDVVHSLKEQRFMAIGRGQSKRHVFLVFTIRVRDGAQYIRPISARYMHQKEIDHYEKETS